MSRLLLAVPVVALVVACGATSSQASNPSLVVFAADRTPTVSGEVYRLDPNGHRVDLSKSPYQDLFPSVSPNGTKVAFIRDLGKPGAHLYEVGISGHGLVRLGPTLSSPSESGCDPTLAWQPGTNRLAVGECGTRSGKLWIVQPGKTTLVSAAGLQPLWSPDGRVLVSSAPSSHSGTVLHAYSSSGRTLWQAPRTFPWLASWSSANVLAVPGPTGVGVYDEAGHLLSKTPGHVAGGPAWSPNGQFLAVIAGGWLVMRTASGEGVLLHQRLAGNHGLAWDGNGRVVVGGYGGCGCKAKSVDVRTGKFSSASSNWFEPLSADRKLAILTPKSGSGYAITVAPTTGGAGKTYANVPLAYSDGPVPSATSLQFVGHGRSVVYGSFNPEPFSNLYTVAPSGGPSRQLTGIKPYASAPSFSPDGSEIAYSWTQFTGLTCKGCASQIRVANADGTGTRVLTTPQDCTFDNTPSWSPDGTKILYSETGCDNPGELFTIPAAGGTPHDLHLAGVNPAWGPSKIAYQGALNTSGGIWTANPDGSSPTKVSSTGHDPAWSATGTLAYFVAAATLKVGSNTVHLPFASVTSLAWAPDGTHFVVVARKTKNAFQDVYTVKTDGTDPVRLTKYYDASGANWR
jgi:Tol biopolymer transport system component